MTEILLAMLGKYGTKEVLGPNSNPEILGFFKELGYDWVKDDSTTSWCSASLSYFAKKCGYEYNKDLSARSWLKMPLMVLKPTIGDIVVFWRNDPNSWEGHVGIYIREDVHNIYCLGGNQNNEINITPIDRNRLLGYRRLKKI
jgi:uncharacterized protein (TIGR02594 family)